MKYLKLKNQIGSGKEKRYAEVVRGSKPAEKKISEATASSRGQSKVETEARTVKVRSDSTGESKNLSPHLIKSAFVEYMNKAEDLDITNYIKFNYLLFSDGIILEIMEESTSPIHWSLEKSQVTITSEISKLQNNEDFESYVKEKTKILNILNRTTIPREFKNLKNFKRDKYLRNKESFPYINVYDTHHQAVRDAYQTKPKITRSNKNFKANPQDILRYVNRKFLKVRLKTKIRSKHIQIYNPEMKSLENGIYIEIKEFKNKYDRLYLLGIMQDEIIVLSNSSHGYRNGTDEIYRTDLESLKRKGAKVILIKQKDSKSIRPEIKKIEEYMADKLKNKEIDPDILKAMGNKEDTWRRVMVDHPGISKNIADHLGDYKKEIDPSTLTLTKSIGSKSTDLIKRVMFGSEGISKNISDFSGKRSQITLLDLQHRASKLQNELDRDCLEIKLELEYIKHMIKLFVGEEDKGRITKAITSSSGESKVDARTGKIITEPVRKSKTNSGLPYLIKSATVLVKLQFWDDIDQRFDDDLQSFTFLLFSNGIVIEMGEDIYSAHYGEVITYYSRINKLKDIRDFESYVKQKTSVRIHKIENLDSNKEDHGYDSEDYGYNSEDYGYVSEDYGYDSEDSDSEPLKLKKISDDNPKPFKPTKSDLITYIDNKFIDKNKKGGISSDRVEYGYDDKYNDLWDDDWLEEKYELLFKKGNDKILFQFTEFDKTMKKLYLVGIESKKIMLNDDPTRYRSTPILIDFRKVISIMRGLKKIRKFMGEKLKIKDISSNNVNLTKALGNKKETTWKRLLVNHAKISSDIAGLLGDSNLRLSDLLVRERKLQTASFYCLGVKLELEYIKSLIRNKLIRNK